MGKLTKNLWRCWIVIIPTISILIFSCKKEIEDLLAPSISMETTFPFLQIHGSETRLGSFKVEDDHSNTLKYFVELQYFSTLQTDLVPDTFYFAQSMDATNGSSIQIPMPLNASSKTGFYWLTTKAGDEQGNDVESNSLFYYHPDSIENNAFLTPFNANDSNGFWQFNKTDSILFEGEFVYDPDSLVSISFYTLPFRTTVASLPQYIDGRLFDPLEDVFLDEFGYIPFSISEDTTHFVISLEDKLGNNLIYSHPAIFR